MNYQSNSQLFNQDHTYNDTQVYPISFNGYNLMSLCWSTTGVIIQTMNAHSLQNIDLTSFVSSLSDWGWVINKKYSNKNISLTLFIQWTSASDLIARIDELKNNLQDVESNFDILVDWTVRRYTATVTSITIPAFKKYADYLDWIEVDMLITSPHWSNPVLSQTYVQWKTTDFSKVVQNQWTYQVYPIIQIITNPSSTLSAIWITHKRVWEISWYTVSITEAIAPNSVVIFDYVNKKVTINDTEVNFSGIMMPMETGQSVFDFDFTGTIDVNAYVLHNPTYL